MSLFSCHSRLQSENQRKRQEGQIQRPFPENQELCGI